MFSILPKIFSSDDDQDAEFKRRMMSNEAEIGGRLFGPVAKGHKRQFFALDRHTWIWYEEWIENGRRQAVTTHYEIRPNGILKIQDGQPNQFLTLEEARNLQAATLKYYELVDASYQQMLTA